MITLYLIDGDKFQLLKINVSSKHLTITGHKQNDSNISASFLLVWDWHSLYISKCHFYCYKNLKYKFYLL